MKFEMIYIIGHGVMGKLLEERIREFYSTSVKTFDKGDRLVIKDGTRTKPNLILVATPISEIAKVLKKVAKINPKHTHVMEIGSVKGGLGSYRAIFNGRNKTLVFSSFHPMVGPLTKDWHIEKWGKKCLAVSVNHRESRLAVEFWKKIGFIVKDVDYKRHDFVVGMLSHLSHFMILSYAKYVKSVLGKEDIELAGTSFEFFSKLAVGAERLSDIYKANKELDSLVAFFTMRMRHDIVSIRRGNVGAG